MRATCKGVLTATTAMMIAQLAVAQEAIELDAIRVEAEEAQDVLGDTEISEEQLRILNPTSLADVFKGESDINASGGAAIARR